MVRFLVIDTKLLDDLREVVNHFILVTMKQPETQQSRKIGRPLSFDRDAALRRAMLLFWKHGYEATSLSALTKAMGVTPPSIYTAFGDKKQLFLEAVTLYIEGGPLTPQQIIEDAPTARAAAERLLESAVLGDTGEDTPPGCLLASAAVSCSDDAADVKAALAAMRGRIEACLKNRFLFAIETGELPANTDADALAGHIMAVIQGLSTLARDGATREKLTRVAASAMRAWPA
ncbi:TetR/AcrR family transcriptional regulator [Rhizobium sp. 32-5/1]|uniref:TetR/AcrR family transcriptional regulator n=1 Tax=Rhizobium sp. 32-5/1 TaxID=3019602 RepID=UPI00240D63A6|nr:TetR/AcrR family transcriptional regulator [Rhizobium sp. 32-5/1]WEZ83772.1 TetR/AcrR family transcriptional regulator [Rhizobium sp. 32-5/1]